MIKKFYVCMTAVFSLSACTSIPANADSRSTASVKNAPYEQYFYGGRTIGGKEIASMIVKRVVDQSNGKITEEVTDCDHNIQSKQRVVSYLVDFQVRLDGFYTLEEKKQNAFRGTGQIKNADWTAWTSHTFSAKDGWTMISDDQIAEVMPKRIGLKVKKIFNAGPKQIELSEDFIEIDVERYEALLKTYTENANNPKLECSYE